MPISEVSTKQQGRSGLGLEAQEATLGRFAEAEGFRFLQTFTETESGSTALGGGSAHTCWRRTEINFRLAAGAIICWTTQ